MVTSGRKFLLVYKFGLLVTTQKFPGDVSGTAESSDVESIGRCNTKDYRNLIYSSLVKLMYSRI